MKGLTYIFDIGSSKISLLACSVKRGKTFVITSVDQAYDGFMDGEFFSTDELNKVFRDLITSMNSRIGEAIKSVYIGVPSEFSACVCKRVFKNFVSSKKLNENDILKLFDGVNDYQKIDEYEVISYSPTRYQLDGVVSEYAIGKKVNELVVDCSYILVKKDFISIINQCMSNCGVTHVDYVSSALAQAQLCVDYFNEDGPFALVDVGHITTSVAVAKGEGLVMLSSFSLGGGHITADLMQVNKLSYIEAEKIKPKVALTIQSKKDERYIIYDNGRTISSLIGITNDVVNARIENIANVINKVLAVSEDFKDIPVYITGDGITNFKGVVNLLENVLERKVKIFKSKLNNDNDKYQTSKISLAKLVGELV